jgi:hypothetical protein
MAWTATDSGGGTWTERRKRENVQHGWSGLGDEDLAGGVASFAAVVPARAAAARAWHRGQLLTGGGIVADPTLAGARETAHSTPPKVSDRSGRASGMLVRQTNPG